jgi:hypothetical protein
VAESMIWGTCPLITSGSAVADPLYAIAKSGAPLCWLNNSKAMRCGRAGSATFSEPGCAFAAAISSWIEPAAKDGCDAIIKGSMPVSVIGSKSFSGSYPNAGKSEGFMVCVPAVPMPSV